MLQRQISMHHARNVSGVYHFLVYCGVQSLNQMLTEGDHLSIAIHFAAMLQCFRPSVDCRRWVGQNWSHLVRMSEVVALDRAVIGFKVSLTFSANQCVQHQAMCAKAISYNFTDYVPVVVLESYQETAVRFDELASQVIDVVVLVSQEGISILVAVVGVKHGLENVFKPPVVEPHSFRLSCQFDRQFTLKSLLKTTVGKVSDRIIGVVHCLKDAPILVELVDDLIPAHAAVRWLELHAQNARLVSRLVDRVVHVPMHMPCDNDRVLPVPNYLG